MKFLRAKIYDALSKKIMNKKISNTIGRKPKLITKKLEKRFNEIGYQEENKNPIVVVRFFSTSGDIWYATEYFHDVKDFYGYASLGDNFKEWGYFYLKELEDYENQGFYVERDLHFKESPLNECLKADGLLQIGYDYFNHHVQLRIKLP